MAYASNTGALNVVSSFPRVWGDRGDEQERIKRIEGRGSGVWKESMILCIVGVAVY